MESKIKKINTFGYYYIRYLAKINYRNKDLNQYKNM